MAYGKYRKRKMYRKRGYRRRGPRLTTLQAASFLANKAYRGVRYIKSMINAEKKKFDTSVTQDTVVDTAGGVINNLSAISAGDDVNNRQGNSILCKGIKLNYTITQNTSAFNTYVRVIVVKDTQNQGSTPSLTDVINAQDFVSKLNVDHLGRYTVLHDKVHNFCATGRTNTVVSKYLKINDHIKYTGTSSNDIYKNVITMFAFSNEATNRPVMVWQARLYFYDN